MTDTAQREPILRVRDLRKYFDTPKGERYTRAGNFIARFGKYGNEDSGGPNAKVAKPEIAFAWVVGVAATDKYIYTGDSINRRMLRSKIVYAAEEKAEIK